jgi:hypothetical protein
MTDYTTEPFMAISLTNQPKINCPKHGIHNQLITSTVDGHQGQWCMLCWLESLGPSLPLVENDDA